MFADIWPPAMILNESIACYRDKGKAVIYGNAEPPKTLDVKLRRIRELDAQSAHR
jgi:hypothetical protein